MNKFYITTTLPYVNAEPHIGFALEIIQADATARYRRLLGYYVFFNFGTDEHGQKIYQKALESGKDPKTFCDVHAEKFDNLKRALNLSYNNFIRTTDKHHIKAAREFWRRSYANGDIYKKTYQAKYCVGCELEKTDSELENGLCPLHPNRELEIIKEENYFFRFSKYQDKLLKLYQDNPDFVVPKSKLKEITEFVKGGLKDFSLSRLKRKMPWGIDVPDDPDHVMYVWFDALINYISALGWPDDEKNFTSFWPGTQVAGKDNLRQQSAIWQAMLMSAGLPNSKQILIHGFISVRGQKISKSLGNVIDPFELVKKYGADAVRYYFLAKIHPFLDSDFTTEKFEQTYNADLANGLGNLVARIARLSETNNLRLNRVKQEKSNRLINKVTPLLNQFRFDKALEAIWSKISMLDKYLDEKEPWKKSKNEVKQILTEIIVGSKKIISLREIGESLKPFLPQTSEKILKQFQGPTIKSQSPLFPRIS